MNQITFNGQWDALAFFQTTAARNRLAISENFVTVPVSGLDGLSELIATSQSSPNIIAVDDSAEGFTTLDNTPSRRIARSVFLSMRHAAGDMDARSQCLAIEHELFRQLMTVLIRQRTALDLNLVHIDPRVTFNEIDRYFAPGAACAWFTIAFQAPLDLTYRPEEWTQ